MNSSPCSQMNAAESLGVGLEELLHVRPRQELQAHRMNLARFVRRPQVIDQRLLAAGVALVGVPHLVREDLDVVLACR